MEENLITQRQAQILAAMLHEARPAWGIDATLKVLERNHDHPASFPDIALASMSAARDPDTKTPGRIFQITQHWPEAIKAKLPDAPKCPDHDTEDAHHCRSCLADVAAGERHPNQVGKGKPKSRKPKPPPDGWRTPATDLKPLPTPRNIPAA